MNMKVDVKPVACYGLFSIDWQKLRCIFISLMQLHDIYFSDSV